MLLLAFFALLLFRSAIESSIEKSGRHYGKEWSRDLTKREKPKKIDEYYAYKLTEAYFCTGKKLWPEDVDDPPLQLFFLLSRWVICRKDDEKASKDVEDFVDRLTIAAKNVTKSKYFEDDTRECFWNAVNSTLTAAFCEKGGQDIFETLIRITTTEWCTFFEFDDKVAKEMCIVGNFLIKFSYVIQTIGRWFIVCPKLDRKKPTGFVSITKRQYDLLSMVKLLEDLSCNYQDQNAIGSIFKESVKDEKFYWFNEKDKTVRKDLADAVGKIASPFVCCLVDLTMKSSKYINT